MAHLSNVTASNRLAELAFVGSISEDTDELIEETEPAEETADVGFGLSIDPNEKYRTSLMSFSNFNLQNQEARLIFHVSTVVNIEMQLQRRPFLGTGDTSRRDQKIRV